ncbi:pyridoxamine 5'-phosphate oxidase family protein [Breoghania sp. JC706]|uniref:pyridoxamine 5'-phosphate oxidase family protein n=1 Tax=Breoghania sp. JC706 TaxID=3117732 RepID=UPI003008B479
MSGTDHQVTSIAQLEALYGEPAKRSLVKELDHISEHYRAFIEAAPFVVIASVGPEGLDCSPRGDPAGFVRVTDRNTVLIPDRRGNNRIDTLRNIVRDPRVSLLFLIPGIGETLRINGRAEITTDPDLRASFTMNGKEPATVLRVSAERVYFQCQKALARSRLWDQETQIERSALPSTGTIIKALDEAFDARAYDEGYAEHLARTIY